MKALVKAGARAKRWLGLAHQASTLLVLVLVLFRVVQDPNTTTTAVPSLHTRAIAIFLFPFNIVPTYLRSALHSPAASRLHKTPWLHLRQT
jgi:hypothetical protein